MNTKEVADYLGIHEKQVYALIKAKRIPCTRVTGKWIFPKTLIDAWIMESAEEGIKNIKDKTNRIQGALIASGSNDPILDILFNYLKQIYPNISLFTSSTGSMEGLRLLSAGITDIALCHLHDPDTNEYTVPFLKEKFSDMSIAVVHLFYRELGFLTSPKSPPVKTIDDLNDKIRFINRQKGSGTRVLFDQLCKKSNIDVSQLNGFDTEVFTHFEVGLAIKSGEADTGIATRAIAQLFDLAFSPLVKESFDMILQKETFFLKEVQAFIETLNSDEFRKKVESLGNYDFSNSGKIIIST